VLKNLKQFACSFDQILKSDCEEPVYQFMASHPSLFNFIHKRGFVLTKFPLGSEYITDFIVLGRELFSNSPFLIATLIEIEPPSTQLFTKSGDPSSKLTHVLRQIQDWKTWVSNNSAYFKDRLISNMLKPTEIKLMTHKLGKADIEDIRNLALRGIRPRYLIICGRRANLTTMDRIRLTEMNEDLRNIHVITYDVILEELLDYIERESQSEWDGIPFTINELGYELR
jgi:hypothetical protein